MSFLVIIAIYNYYLRKYGRRFAAAKRLFVRLYPSYERFGRSLPIFAAMHQKNGACAARRRIAQRAIAGAGARIAAGDRATKARIAAGDRAAKDHIAAGDRATQNGACAARRRIARAIAGAGARIEARRAK